MSFNQCLGLLLFALAGTALMLVAILLALSVYGWPFMIALLVFICLAGLIVFIKA